MRSFLCSTRNEEGSLSAFLVVVLIGLLALLGLVVDGGRALAAHQEAVDVAEQAARAGADALSVEGLRDGVVRMDPTRARMAAEKYLRQAGLNGEVSIQGEWVKVSVTREMRTVLLGIVGLPTIKVVATGRARDVQGITSGFG
jgi:Flp pilus assembly protein TadG